MTGSASALQDALAASAAEARSGYLDGSTTVHAVQLQSWLGLQVPGPGCHVGTGSWDFTRFKPTTSAITCGRCHAAGLRSSATTSTGQLVLDVNS